ncbi:hypothetical protein H0H92_006131 [Tricholoma furcatifolium]|nr:hypothetical protein H0H92_006131 [Tricholoma furcatifolium]
MIYFTKVPHFGSLIPLQGLVPTLAAECFLSSVIILISQTYMAWQIYTALTVGGIGKSRYNTVIPAVVVTAGIAKGSSVVADIIATVALCYQLATSKTGIKQTDTLLKTLIQFIVQRGILVTLTQTFLLVIFFATASHVWWLALHVNVTRLYANTFFAVINGRQSLRKTHNSTNFISASQGTYQGGLGSYAYSPSGVKFPSASDATHAEISASSPPHPLPLPQKHKGAQPVSLLSIDGTHERATPLPLRMCQQVMEGRGCRPEDCPDRYKKGLGGSLGGDSPCPITFDPADIDETTILDAQQRAADEDLEAFKNSIGIVGTHCLVHNQHYEEAIANNKKIKENVLAENPQMAAHWPSTTQWTKNNTCNRAIELEVIVVIHSVLELSAIGYLCVT